MRYGVLVEQPVSHAAVEAAAMVAASVCVCVVCVCMCVFGRRGDGGGGGWGDGVLQGEPVEGMGGLERRGDLHG